MDERGGGEMAKLIYYACPTCSYIMCLYIMCPHWVVLLQTVLEEAEAIDIMQANPMHEDKERQGQEAAANHDDNEGKEAAAKKSPASWGPMRKVKDGEEKEEEFFSNTMQQAPLRAPSVHASTSECMEI
jgi:hypothetical protein